MKLLLQTIILVTSLLCFNSLDLTAQIDFSFVDDQSAMKRQADVYKKPFLVYFTMDICPPCERMKRDVFSDSSISAIANEKYLTYSVNINQYGGKKLGQEHNIQSAPTILFFDANGNLTQRVDGAVSATNFKKMLEENATVAAPNTDFSDFR